MADIGAGGRGEQGQERSGAFRPGRAGRGLDWPAKAGTAGLLFETAWQEWKR